jgi:hypothetical protein
LRLKGISSLPGWQRPLADGAHGHIEEVRQHVMPFAVTSEALKRFDELLAVIGWCRHASSFLPARQGAFAFCQLLGFQLMPRLKAIHVQKLSRPDAGQPDAYPNLKAILTRPIDWELIRQQYDQMVKYVTAVRLGTAETESILRRFTRSNVQHPTYKAFSELGRAVKTIFLCRYL